MDETTSSAGSWSDWFQNVGKGVIDAATQAHYTQPYEIQRLQLQALGTDGYYNEGQRGAVPLTAGGFNISGGMLLLGGLALVAVLMLKD